MPVIKTPVGNNMRSDAQDILAVKKQFKNMGIYNGDDSNPYLDRELDNAIKLYQTANNLKVDGIINPDGETNKLLADREIIYPAQKPELPYKFREKRRLESILGNKIDEFRVNENPDAKGNAPLHTLDFFSEVSENSETIEKEAKKANIDPNLVKAIVYLETTQGWYDRFPAVFDKNSTIRPMNINSEKWKELGYSREDLKKSDTNIKAGIEILKKIKEQNPKMTDKELSTLYNSLGANKVNDYGVRVEQLMKEKPWEK